MTSTQWNSVRSALEKLRESGASDRVFGAHEHKFVMNPAMSEREVSAFEKHHGISLPPDYRSFLIEVGNVGPVEGRL